MTFDWPQGIFCAFILIDLVRHASLHGQARSDEEYNFPLVCLSSGITVALLWWGGFFG